jgi:hypothetical protein
VNISWGKDGVKNCLTNNLSMSLDRIGVIDMGLKSAGATGGVIFSMGVITAWFHCEGTRDRLMERLNKVLKGKDIIGAAIFRNQKGRLSRPVAVGLRWSNR